MTCTSSTRFFIRNNPQPRGDCSSASLASRSGVCGSAMGFPLPWSLMRTMRVACETSTWIVTGLSGWYLLPCSIAFIVASATAVLSFSSRLSGKLSAWTAWPTCSIAWRSLPGSLAYYSCIHRARPSAVENQTYHALYCEPLQDHHYIKARCLQEQESLLFPHMPYPASVPGASPWLAVLRCLLYGASTEGHGQHWHIVAVHC